MKKYSILAVVLMAFALFGGCAGMTPSQQNGALFGGAIGAGIPLIMGEPTGVVAGAALIGGAAGAVLGELFSPQQQYQQYPSYPYSSAPSGLEAIEAQAYAKEKQKILRKRQRVAEKAAKEAGIAAAQAEMAE